jgi:hypothetical protein
MAHMACKVKHNALNLLLLFPTTRQRQRPAVDAGRRLFSPAHQAPG